MDIRTLQLNLPWTIKYSRDFRANPQPHKDFSHALIHAGKALGKLFAFADDMDHDRDVALQTSPTASARYLADLVICALRACNTFPGTVIDLEAATIERLESKNGAKLAIAPAEDPLGNKASAQHRQRAYREDRREWPPEDARPQINIHTPAEERVRMLVAQIDDLDDLEESVGSLRATIGKRDVTIAALEKQLDDERARSSEVIGNLELQILNTSGDRATANATIARMQPLCNIAQRAANAWREHVGDQPSAVLLAALSDLDTTESTYEQACSAAADADMPF